MLSKEQQFALKSQESVHVFWFRRDLRLEDNAGLYHALKSGPVLPIFIFDTNILDQLDDKRDSRVGFIHDQVNTLKTQINALKSDLWVFLGKPEEIFNSLFSNKDISCMHTNEDYEPSAIKRDQRIKTMANDHGIDFKSYKDQIIFAKDEVLKENKTPYTVYTPYSRKWKEKLTPFHYKAYPTARYFGNLMPLSPTPMLSLQEIGFEKSNISFPSATVKPDIIKNYKNTRDIPSLAQGTSRLSMHLRFGTISIRTLVREALKHEQTWLNELIWREFYMSILYHFPHVVSGPFKKNYAGIPWRNNEAEFEAWCEGKTGYPLVDAGMRELNSTGFMHNRVRMVTASFLCKHLLIDWRWGEAYFAQKLLDFELASNNGGWQWAASTGCDAVPYFRIFNPTLQMQRFDPKLTYIKTWVPEYEDPFKYPKPIVNHEIARKRAIEVYKSVMR